MEIPKKIHRPHHKIPTVVWQHWQKHSDAKKVTLEEVRDERTNNPTMREMPNPHTVN